MADIAQGGARTHRADSAPHRFVGGFHQAARHHRRRADEVHAAGIAVPAILDDGDVDIDDVAILEHLPFTGNAVADDVVDRGAHGLGEAAVANVGRNGALHVHDVVVADAVQFLGGDTGLDVGGADVAHFAGQAAGDAHHLDFLRGFQIHAHGAHYR
ncbi:hypothetical protein G6F22_011413 [Rhizopus arrhizus]|nr:hypothetical protein G6F22_011413 [Rhizopus arrhizus]